MACDCVFQRKWRLLKKSESFVDSFSGYWIFFVIEYVIQKCFEYQIKMFYALIGNGQSNELKWIEMSLNVVNAVHLWRRSQYICFWYDQHSNGGYKFFFLLHFNGASHLIGSTCNFLSRNLSMCSNRQYDRVNRWTNTCRMLYK